jgi:ATP synthase I chain
VSDAEADVGVPEVNASSNPATDALFARSLRHIERLIPVLTILISALLAWRWNWGTAIGFLAGSVVAYINFRWLKSTVMALADAVTQSGVHASKPSVVLRFLTRFVLIAFAAYGIFMRYPVAFQGFLGGLFVPVPAIFVEAAVVVYAAIRQGF